MTSRKPSCRPRWHIPPEYLKKCWLVPQMLSNEGCETGRLSSTKLPSDAFGTVRPSRSGYGAGDDATPDEAPLRPSLPVCSPEHWLGELAEEAASLRDRALVLASSLTSRYLRKVQPHCMSFSSGVCSMVYFSSSTTFSLECLQGGVLHSGDGAPALAAVLLGVLSRSRPCFVCSTYNACDSVHFSITACTSGRFPQAVTSVRRSTSSRVLSTLEGFLCAASTALWQTLHGGLFSILHQASEGFLEVMLARGKRHWL
ncbi:uncharacterized protein LOC104653481 [Saimiri boliviensis]|uniref:uncharacterized protein LOC104653481 n=1 Tax=Saimiri boliviensis TaxID=27679 RepID=UPI003D785001